MLTATIFILAALLLVFLITIARLPPELGILALKLEHVGVTR